MRETKYIQDRFAYYIELDKKLKKRYSKDGIIILSIGFEKSKYSKLSDMAFKKYILQEK